MFGKVVASGYRRSHTKRFIPACAGARCCPVGWRNGFASASSSGDSSPDRGGALLEYLLTILPDASRNSIVTSPLGRSFNQYSTTAPDGGFCPTAAPPRPPPPPPRPPSARNVVLGLKTRTSSVGVAPFR